MVDALYVDNMLLNYRQIILQILGKEDFGRSIVVYHCQQRIFIEDYTFYIFLNYLLTMFVSHPMSSETTYMTLAFSEIYSKLILKVSVSKECCQYTLERCPRRNNPDYMNRPQISSLFFFLGKPDFFILIFFHPMKIKDSNELIRLSI